MVKLNYSIPDKKKARVIVNTDAKNEVDDQDINYTHTGKNRPIRVYENLDSHFILGDFYAKLAHFHKNRG